MINRTERRLVFAFTAIAGLMLAACGPTPPHHTEDGGVEDAGGDEVDAGPGDAGDLPADAGTDAGPQPLPENDIAAIRLNADGTPDNTFGTNGVAVVDLSDPSTTANDFAYSLAVDAMDRPVVFGGKKGEGTRTDSDRAVVRLTTAGALDTTFGTGGVQVFNSAGDRDDNPRHGFIQADGKIVAAGYTKLPTGVGAQVANHVVLARLNDDGTYDSTFGTGGLVISNPFSSMDAMSQWGMAEAYVARQQGTNYVTTGYGRSAPTGKVNVVAFRYTETGALDTTWGTSGLFEFDVAGDDDRGRDMVVLPDQRVLMVGSGKPTGTNIDALALILTVDGALDTTFSTDGYELFDLGRPEEAFFGASVAPDGKSAAAAGYVSGQVNGMEADADGALLVIPLTGMGAPVAAIRAISDTANDRFWGITHGADGKIYATGFVDEGGDHHTVVARFGADGVLDTTFGTGGSVRINAAVGETEEAGRAIVVQSDGKIVVVTTVKHQ